MVVFDPRQHQIVMVRNEPGDTTRAVLAGEGFRRLAVPSVKKPAGSGIYRVRGAARRRRAFDMVIGNVSFAKVTPHDPRHNRGRHALHNYFLIKSLCLTDPADSSSRSPPATPSMPATLRPADRWHRWPISSARSGSPNKPSPARQAPMSSSTW